MANKVLPQELMEAQVAQIDLLQAMYPDELLMDQDIDQTLGHLRKWCEGDLSHCGDVPSFLSLTLTLTTDSSVGTTETLSLDIRVPLTSRGDESFSEVPPIVVRLRQPAWLTKTQVAQLSEGIPEDDMLGAIEYIKDEASRFLIHTTTSPSISDTKYTQLVRVWFYFPSISTREKRDDIVNYAPHYGLTGFLLAGKPGILCLEGQSKRIDEYMKFIKTESWGDIPSQHKKVSERYREVGDDVSRAFSDMQEITDQLDKRGERSNRNDMKALEAWLSEKDLVEAFSRVLL